MDNENDDGDAEEDKDEAKPIGLYVREHLGEDDAESGHKIRTSKSLQSDRKATIWSMFRGSRKEKRGPRVQRHARKHRTISRTSERGGSGLRKNVQLLSSREIYVLQSHDSRHTINCECESI